MPKNLGVYNLKTTTDPLRSLKKSQKKQKEPVICLESPTIEKNSRVPNFFMEDGQALDFSDQKLFIDLLGTQNQLIKNWEEV